MNDNQKDISCKTATRVTSVTTRNMGYFEPSATDTGWELRGISILTNHTTRMASTLHT